MYGYLWRIPTLFALMAAFSLGYFAVGVFGVARLRRPLGRALAIAAFAFLIVGNVVAVDAASSLIARSLRTEKEYVDPGVVGVLAPIAFATFAVSVALFSLRGRWAGRAAYGFYAWLVVFLGANIVDRCSPGWCSTIGLPFAWVSWSDSMMVGQRWQLFGHVLAAVINLASFVAVSLVIGRTGRSRPAP